MHKRTNPGNGLKFRVFFTSFALNVARSGLNEPHFNLLYPVSQVRLHLLWVLAMSVKKSLELIQQIVEEMMDWSERCGTCLKVFELYGTTESVAPWLCECPESNTREFHGSVQLNIQGCTCKVRKSNYSRNSVIYCKCD